MKTITAIDQSQCHDDGCQHLSSPDLIVYGKKVPAPFHRQVRHVVAGIYVESSLGAKVFIPWAAIESIEPLLCIPKPVANKTV